MYVLALNIICLFKKHFLIHFIYNYLHFETNSSIFKIKPVIRISTDYVIGSPVIKNWTAHVIIYNKKQHLRALFPV